MLFEVPEGKANTTGWHSSSVVTVYMIYNMNAVYSYSIYDMKQVVGQ